MKFGAVPVASAGGAILAHSVAVKDGKLRKGIVLNNDHIAALEEAGIDRVTVARLDAEDVHEDEAARRLADALVPGPAEANLRINAPFTGRVNVLAHGPGIVELDVAAIHRFNAIHPMITVATVPQHQQMQPGGMVATIKIISYAVPGAAVQSAADAAPAAIRLHRPVMRSASLILSDAPGGPPNEKAIAAMSARLDALTVELGEVRTVAHAVAPLRDAVADATGDVVFVLTASATSDIDDVAPQAVREAGGVIDRYGMPVDPGNLLFIGSMGKKPVIGLPGCARSPALNGADWVLSRIICGVPVTDRDIAMMGVGGLLKEIPSRPQPRSGRAKIPD